MNKSITDCLESDYKLAIEQMLERIFPSADIWDDDIELPLLKMEYMIDDHRDAYSIQTN